MPISLGDIDELIKIAKDAGYSSIIIGGDEPMALVILDRNGRSAILTKGGLAYGQAPKELATWLAEERAWPYPLPIARDVLLEEFGEFLEEGI